jgi:23S rRNA (uracil1939-C5)-methyltransferase
LIAAPHCPVFTPALDAVLARLCANPPNGNGELTIAAGEDGAVCITGDGRQSPGVTILAGEDPVRVSPGVFFQANALLRSTLAAAVHEAAGTGVRALELFSGSGYFTVGLARRFEQVLVVESHGRATRDLAANLAAAGHDNVEVVTGLAERKLESPRLVAFEPDAIVLDPPRKGLDRSSAERIAALRAPRLVYVSCDPGTHARDCARLLGEGYRLASLEAFDLFPQTPHTEAIAVLELAG